MDIVLLIASLAVILVAAELFTNGIEWFGHKLNLAEGAVGSVLAAVATAMPETLIPVIAILGPLLFGGDTEASHAIGVGAILGAPFMLATLAMFVTGIAILVFARRGRRGTGMKVNVRVLGRDVAFFVVGYTVAIGTAFLPPEIAWLKWVAAAFLVVLYAVYVRLHFTDEAEGGDPDELNRLHITRVTSRGGTPQRDDIEVDAFPGDVTIFGHEPPMSLIVAQVVVALGLIIVGAQVFVGAVDQLATQIGLDRTILALIIAPIATELPEKLQRPVGPERQGHPGHGQHHRGDGLPELSADRAGPAVHDVDLHWRQLHQLRLGRRRDPRHAHHLRQHAADRSPVGLVAAHRRAVVPGVHLPRPVHPAGSRRGRPLIPQPCSLGERLGTGARVYFLRREASRACSDRERIWRPEC